MQLDVHIIPLGWEFDRAVLPFTKGADGRKVHAHRAYLVVADVDNDRGFTSQVTKALEDLNIEVKPYIVKRERDGKYVEFHETLRAVADLCYKEAQVAKNRVHVNLSAASKLAAFAAGLGAMAYQHTTRVDMYYVRPAGYAADQPSKEEIEKATRANGLSIGIKSMIFLEPLPLNQPTRDEMQVLRFLHGRHGRRASFLDTIQHLIQCGSEAFEHAKYNDLLTEAQVKSTGRAWSDVGNEAFARKRVALARVRSLRNEAVGVMKRRLAKVIDLKLVRVKTRLKEGQLELTPEGEVYAMMAHDSLEK